MPEPAQPIERKLAAIFAADVAGYSRLMGQDEVGTLRRLAAHREIMDRQVPRVAIDFGEDAEGRNLHVRRLVEPKHWRDRLALVEGRVTYTVLESPDLADALLAYAGKAHVDHIVIGARGSSPVRRFLGSVSSQVVAQAPCNVTLVRARAPADQSPNAP